MAAASWLLAARPGALAQQQIATMSLTVRDTDGDGVVDKEEYMLAARDMVDASGRTDRATRRSIFDYSERLFHTSDVDEDGVLNEAEVEFGQHLGLLGVRRRMQHGPEGDPRGYAEEDFGAAALQELAAKIDTNGDGKVSYEEFAQAMGSLHKAMIPDLKVAFDRADAGGKGFMNPRQLQFAVFLLRETAVRKMTETFFMELDVNQDGKVDTDEIAAGVQMAREKMGDRQCMVDLVSKQFDAADVNKDRALDATEARRLVRHIQTVGDVNAQYRPQQQPQPQQQQPARR